MENNHVCHGRSKYIDMMYHFLRNQVNKGKLELGYCKSEWQLADILTKPLKKVRLDELKRSHEIRILENMN